MSEINELLKKLYQINLDKQTNLLPENLRKDVNILGVTGTLEEVTIKNQDKEITENGTYTADEGYTGLGSVTVNVAGSGGGSTTVEGAKIFTSVEEMNADTSAAVGDLAVVYGLEGQPLAVGSKFRKITFPETVEVAVSSTINFASWLTPVDSSNYLDIMTAHLSASQFYLYIYTDTGTIRVQYTGSNGVYTRKYFTVSGDASIDGDVLDFGMDIEVVTSWNTLLNNFFVTSQPAFNGLYEYNTYTDTDYIKEFPISSFGVESGAAVLNNDNYTELSVSKLRTCLSSLSEINTSDNYPHMIYKRDGVYYLLSVEGTYPVLNHITLDGYIAAYCSGYATAYNYTLTERILDLENGTLTLNTTYSLTGPADTAWRITNIKSDILPILCRYSSAVQIGPEVTSYDMCIYHNGTSNISTKSFTGYISRTKYFMAPTQLNLESADQLLTDVVAYGKNGVVKGDGSLFTNLDYEVLLKGMTNEAPLKRVITKTSNGQYDYEILKNKLYSVSKKNASLLDYVSITTPDDMTTSREFVAQIMINEGLTPVDGRYNGYMLAIVDGWAYAMIYYNVYTSSATHYCFLIKSNDGFKTYTKVGTTKTGTTAEFFFGTVTIHTVYNGVVFCTNYTSDAAPAYELIDLATGTLTRKSVGSTTGAYTKAATTFGDKAVLCIHFRDGYTYLTQYKYVFSTSTATTVSFVHSTSAKNITLTDATEFNGSYYAILKYEVSTTCYVKLIKVDADGNMTAETITTFTFTSGDEIVNYNFSTLAVCGGKLYTLYSGFDLTSSSGCPQLIEINLDSVASSTLYYDFTFDEEISNRYHKATYRLPYCEDDTGFYMYAYGSCYVNLSSKHISTKNAPVSPYSTHVPLLSDKDGVATVLCHYLLPLHNTEKVYRGHKLNSFDGTYGATALVLNGEFADGSTITYGAVLEEFDYN